MNNGTADPFSSVIGTAVGIAYNTLSLVLADVDGDGHIDLIEGIGNEANRLFVRRKFDTSHHLGGSIAVDGMATDVTQVKLSADVKLGDLSTNTGVDFYLSNNGGLKWSLIQQGMPFTFPTTGSDLRWRAELKSLSPFLTPRVHSISIDVDSDNDGIFNSTDPDDDNDDIPDTVEIAATLDPLDASDANGDGDSATNLTEFLSGTGINDGASYPQTFSDVPNIVDHYTAIEALAANGMIEGCDAGLFCSTDVLTRSTWAMWMIQAINGGGYTPAIGTGLLFNDVSSTTFAKDAIEELANSGFTSACDTDLYCPTAAVTRDSLAIYLLRVLRGSGRTPSAAIGGVFDDVVTDTFANDWIEELAAEGITAGCDLNNFCPSAFSARGEAATLLARTLGLVP